MPSRGLLKAVDNDDDDDEMRFWYVCYIVTYVSVSWLMFLFLFPQYKLYNEIQNLKQKYEGEDLTPSALSELTYYNCVIKGRYLMLKFSKEEVLISLVFFSIWYQFSNI